ncbi:MAG: hypothetical protein PUB96_00540 [Helicobacteraceae bacterium]|nr:hypothetical protein [Helicobacteraceae bacterium]
MRDGLSAGLAQENINLTNLALGASFSLQRLYELKRENNQKTIKDADFIIFETNINDAYQITIGVDLQIISKHFKLTCEALYKTNKKILMLILPYQSEHNITQKNKDFITNLHIFYANKFGFNLINLDKYYKQNNLLEFFYTTDSYHQIPAILKALGQNIAKNLHLLKPLKKVESRLLKVEYKIISPQDLIIKGKELEKTQRSNSVFNETLFKLTCDSTLHFPQALYNYEILGFGSWNDKKWEDFFSLCFKDSKEKHIKTIMSNQLLFHSFYDKFIISKDSTITINTLDSTTQCSVWVTKNAKPNNNYCLITQFLLAKIENFNNEFLKAKSQSIESKYNFNFLIPNITLYKEAIEQYNARMDAVKLKPKLDEINKLKQELESQKPPLEAIEKIKNQLSYKLGQELIKTHKSRFKLGYLTLFFRLKKIAKKHKKMQNTNSKKQ